MNRAGVMLTVAFVLFAAMGIIFSAISTADFVAHLDRQMHSVSCSFIPGVEGSGRELSSGCLTVMMSPYSSVFRDRTWGGVPISLPSLSIFVYLLWLGFTLLFSGRYRRPVYLLWMVAAAALPAGVSLAYWHVSVFDIGHVCKVCIMIYVASFGALVSAMTALIFQIRDDADRPFLNLPWRWYAAAFAGGVLFIAVPLGVYVALKPAYLDEMSRCGELLHPEDKYDVRVREATIPGAVTAVEIIDPLCPACLSFRDRLKTGGFDTEFSLEYMMFPLDNKCNWMVSEAMHPGACTMSEAVLCGGNRAVDILNWSLENQEELRRLGAESPEGLKARVIAEFPEVSGCIGKPAVAQKLNKSMRWITSNAVKVMTPQLFVNGRKLCDEDSDLGMEFALRRLLEHARNNP